MKSLSFIGAVLLCAPVCAQEGPFDPAAWPGTIDPGATVHYVVVGDAIEIPDDAAHWTPTLQILAGGDHDTAPIDIGGFEGRKATASYLNIADTDYTAWAEEPVIDILVQVYGDAGVLNAAGQPRNYNFLLGALPELSFPLGGQIPAEGQNFKWNWVLFRVNNDMRPSDGARFLGTLPDTPQGAFSNGGVNGGTIRFENVPGLTVRAVAFGPQGAFGEPEAINIFQPAEECDPEPLTNHVYVDFDSGQSRHLQLLSGGDQGSVVEPDIGPQADRRTAARPEGSYLNFGITENYLGFPCNAPHPFKICVDYYDDPELAGVVFGPEAYATDATGGVGFVDVSQRQTLAGSGRWVRRSWLIGGANLAGVNTAPLTGLVRLHFDGAPVSVSRVDMAIIREGEHPLAGADPLADCQRDPALCEGMYGDYVEMDLHQDVFEGLGPGSSGGDQEMIQEEAGPDEDRRMAIRPAREDGTPPHDHGYLNFAITDGRLGPTTQPNARLAICLTFFDDPELQNQAFRPEVHRTERADGSTDFAFPPATQAVTLQGSNRWVDAYFEVPNVKFEGVNQGPQGAVRFFATAKIAISRVRYSVIRPCGPTEGFNQLELSKPPLLVTHETDGVHARWVAGQNWNVQFNDTLGSGQWQPATETPVVEDFENVLVLPADESPHRFYRLVK